MCREHGWVEAAAGHDAHQWRDCAASNETCGDRDVTGPQLLEVERCGMAVHADVRDPSSGSNQFSCQLERVRHANCLERSVCAESVGELHDLREGILASVVDRDIGPEAPSALESTVGGLDRKDPAGCVEAGCEHRSETDRAGADH